MAIDIYHIPVCPFSQRLEILLALKGCSDMVQFHVVDITVPRPDWLLEKSQGTTALPLLETDDGFVIKESLVIQQYLEDITPDHPVAQQDPARKAIENMLVALSDDFAMAGYLMILNQDPEKKADCEKRLLDVYRKMNLLINRYSPDGTYLFDDYGWAEVVFTPLFMRFWFLDYYENFTLPDTAEFKRVMHWRDSCLAHPAAQQVTKEQIVKLYFDYAKGAGNGALVKGRSVSSFTFEPDWPSRPWPPKDKFASNPSDQELGLA